MDQDDSFPEDFVCPTTNLCLRRHYGKQEYCANDSLQFL